MFRETFEAALIVGIIIVYLCKTKNRQHVKYVIWGAAAAVLCSLVMGYAIYSVWGGLEGTGEQLFEGTMMFLAAGLVGWMVAWVAGQKNFVKNIEQQVEVKLGRKSLYGLFAVSFIAVFREGMETAIFLIAAFFRAKEDVSIPLAVLGIVAAIALSAAIFTALVRINLSHILLATGILLVLFAAGLVAHGVHEFQEAGVLGKENAIIDTSNILREKSELGMIARGFFGYTEKPTPTELLAYFAYVFGICGIFAIYRR